MPLNKKFQTQSAKVPSSKLPPLSTSSQDSDSGSTSSRLSTTTSRLARTCDRYNNLNIIDSEASLTDDKTKSEIKQRTLFNKGISGCSKPSTSVIRNSARSSDCKGATTDHKSAADRDSSQLYLSSLFPSNKTPTQSTARTRCKIGEGTR